MADAAMLAVRRSQLTETLRSELELSIDDRVSRCLEVEHHGIVANHHFAAASSEVLTLYRDGYFLSTVMVSQAVSEGIWDFLLERAGLTPAKDHQSLISSLVESSRISTEAGEAFTRIFRSFRNDYHHMNPSVSSRPTQDLARRTIRDLAVIEQDVFAFTIDQGRLIPLRPENWVTNTDGTVSVYLRLG